MRTLPGRHVDLHRPALRLGCGVDLEVSAELEESAFHSDAELPDGVVRRLGLLGSPESECVPSRRLDVESAAVVYDLETLAAHAQAYVETREVGLFIGPEPLRPVHAVVYQIEDRAVEGNVPHEHVDEKRLRGHRVDLPRIVSHCCPATPSIQSDGPLARPYRTLVPHSSVPRGRRVSAFASARRCSEHGLAPLNEPLEVALRHLFGYRTVGDPVSRARHSIEELAVFQLLASPGRPTADPRPNVAVAIRSVQIYSTRRG